MRNPALLFFIVLIAFSNSLTLLCDKLSQGNCKSNYFSLNDTVCTDNMQTDVHWRITYNGSFPVLIVDVKCYNESGHLLFHSDVVKGSTKNARKSFEHSIEINAGYCVFSGCGRINNYFFCKNKDKFTCTYKRSSSIQPTTSTMPPRADFDLLTYSYNLLSNFEMNSFTSKDHNKLQPTILSSLQLAPKVFQPFQASRSTTPLLNVILPISITLSLFIFLATFMLIVIVSVRLCNIWKMEFGKRKVTNSTTIADEDDFQKDDIFSIKEYTNVIRKADSVITVYTCS